MSDVPRFGSSNPTKVPRLDTPMNVNRSLLAATAAATVAVFLVVAGGMSAVTGSIGVGLVLGAFCSAWVGPGFGVIVGGVRTALRSESIDLQSRMDAASLRAVPVETHAQPE